MATLGKRMEAQSGTFKDANAVTLLPAGYTYFGQFVDHDITRDDTLLENAGSVPPEQTANLTGPWLDLSQLYGDGPGSARSAKLYTDGACFRLGEREPPGETFDVPLDDETREPLLADDRDNENVIIRQIHALFLKLHNVAVRELGIGPDEARFLTARQRVRWQYQWLVRNDYLREVCSDEAYTAVVQKCEPIINWDGRFSIPVEFSQAAFRFGHSMVRETYKISHENPNVPLVQLFAETRRKANLPLELAIDWARFLDTGSASEKAMAIDTTLVPPLFSLPVPHFHHFICADPADQPPQLPVRTLQRGAATGLPTGEEVTCALGRSQLRARKELSTKVDPWLVLDEVGLRGRTPLWYYILVEAEQQENGRRLGYVGSRLVAEVIEASLWADPDSYLNHEGPDWTPPDWIDPDGNTISVRRLADVPKVVGLYKSQGKS